MKYLDLATNRLRLFAAIDSRWFEASTVAIAVSCHAVSELLQSLLVNCAPDIKGLVCPRNMCVGS